MRQEPSSRSSIARSARDARWVGRSSMAASSIRTASSSSRQVMPMAPWPTAGSMSVAIGSAAVAVGELATAPRRLSPAMASNVAPRRPPPTLRSRVATLPRSGTTLQVRPALQQLRLAAQRRGADDAALRQLGKRSAPARDQRVARILARQRRGEDDRLRQPRRQVLDRMHRQIDPPVQQRLVDLLGEQALAADLGQRPVEDPVAGGLDDDHLDRRPARPAPAGSAAAARRSPRSAPGPAGCRGCRCAGAGSVTKAGTARRAPRLYRSRSHSSGGRGAAERLDIRPMLVLGIETSCDETAVAVVDGDRRILAERILLAARRAPPLWRRRAGDRGARPSRSTWTG